MSIMLHVPLERAETLLYKNGEMDPHLAALEVELYQKCAQNPEMYVGYFKSGHTIVETFSQAQEGAKRVAELEQTKDGEIPIEFVVVNGIKSK